MIKHQLRAAEKYGAEGLVDGYHIHPELELLLVESDGVVCHINRREYVLSSGTLLLFNNLERHSLSISGQGYHRLLLMFRPAYLRDIIGRFPQLLSCFFYRPVPEANILKLSKSEADSIRHKMKELIGIRAAQGEPSVLPADSVGGAGRIEEQESFFQDTECMAESTSPAAEYTAELMSPDTEFTADSTKAEYVRIEGSFANTESILTLEGEIQDLYLKLQLSCLLMEVNGLHNKYYPKEDSADDDFSLISCLLQYVQEHLEDSELLHLDNLAREFALSRTVLCNSFHNGTGTSLRQYIIDCRIWQAQEYMAAGVPIHEAGLRVGYSDQAHFTRVFKQKTGMTPREWKMSKGK